MDGHKDCVCDVQLPVSMTGCVLNVLVNVSVLVSMTGSVLKVLENVSISVLMTGCVLKGLMNVSMPLTLSVSMTVNGANFPPEINWKASLTPIPFSYSRSNLILLFLAFIQAS